MSILNNILSGITPKAIAPELPIYRLSDRDVSINDLDMQDIRPVVFGEISNRNTNKKKLEANVILNTIFNRVKQNKENGTPKSIQEIISEPKQYQAYKGPQYEIYHNPILPGDIAKKKEVDSILDEIYNQIRSGKYKDNTGGAAFYNHLPNGKILYNQKPLFTGKKK